jgi:hypothetical protein
MIQMAFWKEITTTAGMSDNSTTNRGEGKTANSTTQLAMDGFLSKVYYVKSF